MSTEYNGWRNVETWRVQLHLQNNAELAEAAERMAGEISRRLEHDGPARDPRATRELAGALREHVVDGIHQLLPVGGGDGLPMLLVDTVDTALGRVDWDEIARHWLTAVGVGR